MSQSPLWHPSVLDSTLGNADPQTFHTHLVSLQNSDGNGSWHFLDNGNTDMQLNRHSGGPINEPRSAGPVSIRLLFIIMSTDGLQSVGIIWITGRQYTDFRAKPLHNFSLQNFIFFKTVYHQFSNTRHTQSQNINVSCLVLQLSLLAQSIEARC